MYKSALLLFVSFVLSEAQQFHQQFHQNTPAYHPLVNGIRADNKREFKLCRKPPPAAHKAQVVQVEVGGPACRTWPCRLRAKDEGIFEITLQSVANYQITQMFSTVNVYFKLNRFTSVQKMRVEDRNSPTNQVCRYTFPPCPFNPGTTVSVRKTVRVPRQASLFKGPATVEFRIEDEHQQVVSCFTALVLVM